MLPYITNHAPWFTFLVHPRDRSDLLRAGVGSILQHYSYDDAEFIAKACSLPPLVVADIRFGFGPVRGEVVVAMCLPRQIMSKSGRRAVLRSAELAAERGAKVLGLGALVSPATAGGLLLVKHLGGHVTVTNGNAYTAAVVRSNVLEAASFLSSNDCRVAIVGCTGSVGSVLSQLLADTGMDLLLVGRSKERVRAVLSSLSRRAIFSGAVCDVREADIVVLLTNDPSAKLRPSALKPGTVVIDVAQPLSIPRDVRPEFHAHGVIVVDGGIVRIPGYSCTYHTNMPAQDCVFACMAETYLFAREGMRVHSVGRPTIDLALHLERVARKYGVAPCSLDSDLNLGDLSRQSSNGVDRLGPDFSRNSDVGSVL